MRHFVLAHSKVLSSDQVLDCDECVVFEAAVRWLKAEGYARDNLRVEVCMRSHVHDYVLHSLQGAPIGSYTLDAFPYEVLTQLDVLATLDSRLCMFI